MEDRMSQRDQLRSIELSDINAKVSCLLCRGYLIDCVVAEECGHVFCRSCIARYIGNGMVTCPKCTVLLNKDDPGEPFHKLQPDRTLQRLVYKLVPDLLSRETERRSQYLGSERDARQEIKLSVGNDILFFNERSCICVELTPKHIDRNPGGVDFKGIIKSGQFLRVEMSTPLTVITEYVKLRLNLLDSKFQVRLSEDRTDKSLPHTFRVIEVAYLTKWNRKRPLQLYYEIFECDWTSNDCERLQPSTPMLASESQSSLANEQSNNRIETSSSALAPGKDYPSIGQNSSSPHPSRGLVHRPSTDLFRHHEKQSLSAGRNLKLKFNKNDVGRWKVASNGVHRHLHNAANQSLPTHPVPVHGTGKHHYSPYQSSTRRLDDELGTCSSFLQREKDKALQAQTIYVDAESEYPECRKRLVVDLRDTIKSTKVAKVLPIPAILAVTDHGSQCMLPDDLMLEKDPVSSILYSTGLVPCNAKNAKGMFSIQQILSMDT